MGTLNLLFLLSCILTTLPLTIAQICSNNFTANSTYGVNRNLILSSLPYNVTANRGFYNATVTLQDSETIYALALCRGDLTNESCFECVNSSSHYIMTSCPNQKDALDWGSTSHCIVRYSNKSFFASMDSQPARVVFGGNITDYIDEFDKTLDDLVDELIIRAAEGNSSLKFATGEKNYTQYKYENIVYGLLQCVPGLSPVDCTSCIRAAVGVYKTSFLRRRFVNVMTPSCIFQYDLSDFVESSVGALNCSNDFPANSTYGINRNLILSSLSYQVTAHRGFYNASVTLQDSETIYALALCRGDLTNQSCFECVNSASQTIRTRTNCPNQKNALDWGSTSRCIVRFSNKSFFASLDANPVSVVYGGYITDYIDEVDKTLDDLVDELISKAAEGNSSLKFATGDKNYTQYQYENLVYGLMQCVPGLSPDDCTSCLRAAMALYKDGSLRRRSVNVMTPSCIFRYGLSPFAESPGGDAPPPPPPPPPPPGKDDNTTQTVIIIVVSTIGSVIGFIVCVCIFLRKRKQKKNPKQKVEVFEAEDQIGIMGSLQYDFETISIATDNFSDGNKLGQGGFGAVYQGRLLNGQEIAVKRLAKESQQGEIEFKNEVMLVAKLQHRNLVRLLGFCLEGTERLLIYEFVPQSSLDHLIFNPNGRKLLGWDRRYKIIGGVSRGLLYLHEDSRLRIIHRDLKASNVLLDEDMNPKISDFGMARLFVVDEAQGSTNRIVGTYGYMAPEYAMHGQFSVKSDVFSFGVLVLEILSGQKNNSTRNGENVEDLLSYAWKTWREGTASNLIDPTLRDNSGSMREMIRCIHIGLLCVQENVAERPTMASVVLMLSSSSLSLPVPSEPAFFLRSGSTNSKVPLLQEHSSELVVSGHSINEVSITELYPR